MSSIDKGQSKYALDCASSRSVLFARSPQIFNRNKQTTFKGEGVTSNTSIRSRVSVALCGLMMALIGAPSLRAQTHSDTGPRPNPQTWRNVYKIWKKS